MIKAARGRITKIHRLSTHDGPGLRTTLFFKGCPLRCLWCHNPETISALPELEWTAKKCIHCDECAKACPDGLVKITEKGLAWDDENCIRCEACTDACPSKALVMLGAKTHTVGDLLAEIKKDERYFQNSGGGVTFSGGEPLFQADFVTQLAQKCKKEGLNVALDTCGYVSEKKLLSILPYTDFIFYDLKAYNEEEHIQFTGRSNKKIFQNLKTIASPEWDHLDFEIWIRTPLVPGLTGNEQNIRNLGKLISGLNTRKVTRWELLSFHNLCGDKYNKLGKTWKLRELELFSGEEIMHLTQVAREAVNHQVQVSLSGFSSKKHH